MWYALIILAYLSGVVVTHIYTKRHIRNNEPAEDWMEVYLFSLISLLSWIAMAIWMLCELWEKIEIKPPKWF